MRSYFENIICFLLLTGIYIPSTYGQEKNKKTGNYRIEIIEIKPPKAGGRIEYKKEHNSRENALKELNRVLINIYELGCIGSGYDSLKENKNSITAYLKQSEKFMFGRISRGNAEEEALRACDFREKIYRDKTFRYRELSRFFERLLKYYENRGYPFIEVKLDSIRIEEEKIYGTLKISKNNKIIIDSIYITGDAERERKYIYNYTGIKPKDYYRQNAADNIETKLRASEILNVTKSPEYVFRRSKTDIILHVDRRNASQFDGIIGMLPDNEKKGNVMISGDVKLRLQNSFHRGELIDFNWQHREKRSQELNTEFSYPFLFNTLFGADIRFTLYKKDTLYLNLTTNTGILYNTGGKDYIKGYYESRKSNLIEVPAAEKLRILPENADFSTTLYGIEYSKSKLDYAINPSKGYRIKINAGAGKKKIRKNRKIEDSLYSGLALNTSVYRGEAELGAFIPLERKSTVLTESKTGGLYNDNLFSNEMYRIGGLKTLRGFDDESIYASLYSIINIEYRYLFEQDSFFSLFWNGGYYECRQQDRFTSDLLFGFGAGISFRTRAGIFSLNYALGRQKDIPIQLRAAKIHFGIVNRF